MSKLQPRDEKSKLTGEANQMAISADEEREVLDELELSKQSFRDSFITFVEIAADMNKVIKERREIAGKGKMMTQSS